MENTNVSQAVKSVNVEKRLSAKTGRPYYMLVLTLVNGSQLESMSDTASCELLKILAPGKAV